MMTNFHLNTTVVAIFPNVCLWRRSLCSDFVLTLKNRIEPPSYARTACCYYVVAIWPSFLFDSFVKICATCEIFLGKWFTAPPPRQKMFLRGYLGMSRPKQRKMLCDYCNQEASITCSGCRLASYCGTEHRKNDWKLHRRKCLG